MTPTTTTHRGKTPRQPKETTMTAAPLFPKWMISGYIGPKPPQRRTYAIFPDCTEREILKRVSPVSGRGKDYEVTTPTGTVERNNLLRDLKHWLEKDFPGVTFTARK